MNKEYLPFYNSLNEKEKTFWLDCTKEALIDHLIANIKNGEKLLKRIDKSIEYLSFIIKRFEEIEDKELITNRLVDIEIIYKLLEILGDKE